MNTANTHSRRRWWRWTLLGLSAVAAILFGCPSDSTFVDRTEDVSYGLGYVADSGSKSGYVLKPLLMDVYEPAGGASSDRPAVILVHGGSFEEGSKESDEIVETANYFARNGYVAFAINYRLTSDNPPAPGVWDAFNLPATLHAATVDAKTAVRHVRANAEQYGVDPDRIAMLGESAGAVAGIAVAVTGAGSYDNDGSSFPLPAENNPSVSPRIQAYIHLWGGSDHVLLDVGLNEPPIMIVHGTEDDRFFTWFESSERLHALLELFNIPHEFYQAEGYGHGAWNYSTNFKGVKELSLEFLDEHL